MHFFFILDVLDITPRSLPERRHSVEYIKRGRMDEAMKTDYLCGT
jgi:hypothetical protein